MSREKHVNEGALETELLLLTAAGEAVHDNPGGSGRHEAE